MTEKNYQEMHNEKLKKLQEEILGSKINDILQVKQLSNSKLDSITAKMDEIIQKRNPNRKVYIDFSYRTGKIMGIVRAIVNNGADRQALLEASGLSNEIVDLYYGIIGNMPYVQNKILVYGKAMDHVNAKDYIKIVAVALGVVVEEADLFDITEERCTQLYQAKLAECIETLKAEQEQGEAIEYEE